MLNNAFNFTIAENSDFNWKYERSHIVVIGKMWVRGWNAEVRRPPFHELKTLLRCKNPRASFNPIEDDLICQNMHLP